MSKNEEKVIDAVIEEEEKTYFLPRVLAYVIDIIIVSIITASIMMVIPQNKNYDKYVEEYKKIQTDYMDKKIDTKEYVDKSAPVVYDIDYSNCASMIAEVVVFMGYFIGVQYALKGKTLGKKLMKIKVVSTKNENLTLNQIVIRALIVNSVLINLLIIGALLFVGKDYYYYTSLGFQALEGLLVIVSLVMILFRKDGRGLHDLCASTRVINDK